MNEMDLLNRLWDEVPLREVSPRTEDLFFTGLHDPGTKPGHGRGLVARPSRSWQTPVLGRPARLALAGTLALAVAGGTVTAAVVSSLGPGVHAATDLNAVTLADRAAAAALRGPDVRPGQWVYREFMVVPGDRSEGTAQMWSTADGRLTAVRAYGRLLETRAQYDGTASYRDLASLPASPAALDAYLASLNGPGTPSQRDTFAFNAIQGLLYDYTVPPPVAAELYHALAAIPGIAVNGNATDVAGRRGVAFTLALTPGGTSTAGGFVSGTAASDTGEIILDPRDYHLLGYATLTPGGHPLKSVAILRQAFVSGPGVRPGPARQGAHPA